jgi:hypothetical protein
MSRFITNQTHPLIENSNEYIFFNKTISIHSEDRDIIKYPNSSLFELDLPQDYYNISKVTLGNYNFPLYNNVFSLSQNNLTFSFLLQSLSITIPTSMEPVILYNIPFITYITQGTYTTSQMPIELTNRMNEAVTLYVLNYYEQNGITDTSYTYSSFTVTYNEVSFKLFFGNTSSGFTITNEDPVYMNNVLLSNTCQNGSIQNYSKWGLPSYLGFFRKNVSSIETTTPPRFYALSGPSSYWLIPPGTNQTCYYLEAPLKMNLLGNLYFYIDIQLFNSIDELTPFSSYNLIKETHTNQSTGRVNSSFAKIPTNLTTTQNSLEPWYNSPAYKIFYPPAERIRKVRIKIRYHDGTLVNFDNFDYSFVLVFSILIPQTLRDSTCLDPTASQGFNNSFGSQK